MDSTEIAQRCADAMVARDAASKALGIAIEIPQAGSAVAQMTVRDDMVNGFDVCHGGLLFTLADTAFAFACNAYDNVTFAASCTRGLPGQEAWLLHGRGPQPARRGDRHVSRTLGEPRRAPVVSVSAGSAHRLK
jgi:acyl-CoA thioesterase